jgi:hypothetical protein
LFKRRVLEATKKTVKTFPNAALRRVSPLAVARNICAFRVPV